MTPIALEGPGEMLAAAMDDYLPKPVRSEDLAVMLNRWHNDIPPHGNGESQEATLLSATDLKRQTTSLP